MSDTKFAVILVYSTSHAMRIERILIAANIQCKLIPVPRQLSSDCGVCVRFYQDDKEKVMQKVVEAQVEIQGIFDF